jgi:hypothetical protein
LSVCAGGALVSAALSLMGAMDRAGRARGQGGKGRKRAGALERFAFSSRCSLS